MTWKTCNKQNSHPQLFDEIITQCTMRYATVKAGGIAFGGTASFIQSAKIVVKVYSPARTLYLNKKPQCRSFNGMYPFDNNHKLCNSCENKTACTPQVCLDCTYITTPYRIILAYTSAQNFLLFENKCKIKNISLNNKTILLSVKNRNKWGEVLFDLI